MHDPNAPWRYHAVRGIVSAFVPQSQVGCLAGLFLLVVAGMLVGLFRGVEPALAVGALIVLVALIRRALRAEIRREDGRGEAFGQGQFAGRRRPDRQRASRGHARASAAG